MKKLLLLVAVVLAFSFTALAQDTGATGSSGSSGQTSTESTTTTKTKKSKKSGGEMAGGEMKGGGAAKESTITGCLAKSADGNGYTLTNGRYKKGVEVKSSEDLSAHVGHQVKLTGSMEKPTAGESGGAGAKGQTMRTFNATKVDHIADTCTKGGAKAAKGGDMGAMGSDTGTKGGKKSKKGAGASDTTSTTPK